MQKCEYRSDIQIRFSLGCNAKTIYDELVLSKGDLAPSIRTVERWVAYFKKGGVDLEDDPRPGCPITASTKSNIELVRNAIDENPWSTYDDLEELTLLSRVTLERIIYDHLKLRKITSRWVPHDLTPKNMQDRVEICQEYLSKFESNQWRLCDIITGNESIFYWKQIRRKQSNAS